MDFRRALTGYDREDCESINKGRVQEKKEAFLLLKISRRDEFCLGYIDLGYLWAYWIKVWQHSHGELLKVGVTSSSAQGRNLG